MLLKNMGHFRALIFLKQHVGERGDLEHESSILLSNIGEIALITWRVHFVGPSERLVVTSTPQRDVSGINTVFSSSVDKCQDGRAV